MVHSFLLIFATIYPNSTTHLGTTTRGMVFTSEKCRPIISEMHMKLIPDSPCSLDTNAVQQILEKEGKLLYAEMFCEALEA